MITPQDAALDEALTKLGELFEHVVIIADAPDMEFPGEDNPSLFTRHKGPTWTCCGMMSAYQRMMMDYFMAQKDTPRGSD